MRSPGLVLVMLAGLVGALTSVLVAAKPSPVVLTRPIVHVASVAPMHSADPAPAEAVPEQPPRAALAGHPLLPSSLAALDDELLHSPMLRDPAFMAEVRRWVRFWARERPEWLPVYLARMTWFEAIVDTTLAAHGLPWSLRYLPVIESGYSPSAVSSARAAGLWQFMASTAEDYGVEVTRFVDQRRDPFVSTAAAADFLVSLRDEFNCWFLALAAYNAGPDRIRKILRRHAPGRRLSDRLYWDIRRALPRETREFVPNLIGAMIVVSDPEAFGYRIPEPRPFEFDRVPVRGVFTFEGLARATGTSRDEIARLNPEYLRGVTPSRRTVDVRVPLGRGQAVRDYYSPEAQAARRGTDGR